MHGIGCFLFFFETLWKIFVFLKNYSTDFQKSGTNVNSGYSSVSLLTPLVSFYLTSFSTAFEKVCGGIFDPIFWIFLHFLENYPSKSEIFGSIEKTGYGKLPCISGYAQTFFTQKIMALKIVFFKNIFRVF